MQIFNSRAKESSSRSSDQQQMETQFSETYTNYHSLFEITSANGQQDLSPCDISYYLRINSYYSQQSPNKFLGKAVQLNCLSIILLRNPEMETALVLQVNCKNAKEGS